MIEDILGLMTLVYLGTHATSRIVSSITDEPFESQEQLQEFVDQRVSKSKKPHPKVTCRLEPYRQCSLKVGDNIYMLFVGSRNLAKHELAHILGGHLKAGNLVVRYGYGEEYLRKGFDRVMGFIGYFFVYEPLAVISQIRK